MAGIPKIPGGMEDSAVAVKEEHGTLRVTTPRGAVAVAVTPEGVAAAALNLAQCLKPWAVDPIQVAPTWFNYRSRGGTTLAMARLGSQLGLWILR